MQTTYWKVHVCGSMFNGLLYIQNGVQIKTSQHRHEEPHQTLFDVWFALLMSVLQQLCWISSLTCGAMLGGSTIPYMALERHVRHKRITDKINQNQYIYHSTLNS